MPAVELKNVDAESTSGSIAHKMSTHWLGAISPLAIVKQQLRVKLR